MSFIWVYTFHSFHSPFLLASFLCSLCCVCVYIFIAIIYNTIVSFNVWPVGKHNTFWLRKLVYTYTRVGEWLTFLLACKRLKEREREEKKRRERWFNFLSILNGQFKSLWPVLMDPLAVIKCLGYMFIVVIRFIHSF